MIRYDLTCADGHSFDGWFGDSAAFDEQVGRGLVTCPVCGSSAIEKAIMAPRVGKAAAAPAAPAETPKYAMGGADPQTAAMLELVRKVRRHLVENADDVGERFPEEARRIHYEEAERRSIYGQASPEEARALVEEGIEIHALPKLPEDKN